MGIKISDILESTTANKIIAEAINIRYNNETQKQFNDKIANDVTALAQYIQDTYTKEQIDTLIFNLASINVDIVESLPTEHISTTTIYLIKDDSTEETAYVEWLYVNGSWRSIGSTRINFSNYYTKIQISAFLEAINQSIHNLDVAIEQITRDIGDLQETDGILSEHIDNLDDAVTVATDTINEVKDTVDNLIIDPQHYDELDSSKVIYNNTNVKAVLDQLLYKAPTASFVINIPSIKSYEYGDTVTALKGIVTFDTYNGAVKRLSLTYKINNISTTVNLTAQEGTSVNFDLNDLNLNNTTEVSVSIQDDKDTIRSSTKQSINFMYKSFCFASDKESISVTDIPTTGGYLRPSKALGQVEIPCSASARYAYIAIPAAYCSTEPVITDTNGFVITLPNECKFAYSNYVNGKGITVPMKVYRLRHPYTSPVTINIK